MKKHIFTFSAALLAALLSGCGSSEPPSAPEVSEPRSLPIAGAESTPDDYVNNNARCIKTTRNYNNGELSRTVTKTLDEHGNVIKDSSSWGDNYYTYEYNADGSVLVKRGDDGREEYEYENGLETKRVKYDENGKELSVTTHAYDEYGNVTSIVYEMDGEVAGSSSFGYELDENGRWLAQYSYDENGGIDLSAACVRDENGNIISGTFDDGYTLSTYEYKYDERGNETDYRGIDSSDGEAYRERHIVTEYDGQGRISISRETEYRLEDGAERLVSLSEYEYL